MKTLEELVRESGIKYRVLGGDLIFVTNASALETFFKLTAREVAQDIADRIRETYLHEHAEGIAFNIETLYGIHGDYGDR